MCHEQPSANKKIQADIGKSAQGRLIRRWLSKQ